MIQDEQEYDFLMPSYFPHFACKMGACRRACCVGWPICISLEDYFKLTGEACSDELRRKLDRGVKVSLRPLPDEYAQILPRYDGDCSLRLPDGRCAIHAELGERALADVCRLYPRGFRTEPGCEASCSNSCEAVLEMLFQREEPIDFVRRTLRVALPEQRRRLFTFPTMGREIDIRLWLIRKMQDRTKSLPRRLRQIGIGLRDLEPILEHPNAAALERLLTAEPAEPTESAAEFAVNEGHLRLGLRTMEELIRCLDARSDSIRQYGEEALVYFGNGDDVYERYVQSKTRFEAHFPRWEIWFEHMLVNHMFFSQFPFQERPESPWSEFVAICAVYALLRFLSLGWMADRQNLSQLVDVCAALFRLIDHTAFDSYAADLFRKLGCHEPEQVFDLIRL